METLLPTKQEYDAKPFDHTEEEFNIEVEKTIKEEYNRHLEKILRDMKFIKQGFSARYHCCNSPKYLSDFGRHDCQEDFHRKIVQCAYPSHLPARQRLVNTFRAKGYTVIDNLNEQRELSIQAKRCDEEFFKKVFYVIVI